MIPTFLVTLYIQSDPLVSQSSIIAILLLIEQIIFMYKES